MITKKDLINFAYTKSGIKFSWNSLKLNSQALKAGIDAKTLKKFGSTTESMGNA